MHSFRFYSYIVLILKFYFSTIGWIWGDSLAKKNKDAIELYNEGEIDEALSKWQDAQTESPEKKELHYNIGGALHKKKEYEDAYREYVKSLPLKDTDIRTKAYYNMGNTNYRMGKLTEAIKNYEDTLEINPDDEDAKHNIEFVRKKLEEEKEKQKKESQDKEGRELEDKGDSEAQREELEAQDGEQDEQKLEESSRPEEKKEEERKAQEASKGKQNEMSEEDAVRLLDALKDDEKDLQKELRRLPVEGRYRVDKDW